MATYLAKSEPDDYSYDDLERDGRTPWDGVSNAAACKHLRAMTTGDEVLIYHTGGEKQIVGLAVVVSAPYEDPENPGMTAKGETKFPIIDVKPRARATTPVTLAALKADDRFADFALVKQPRLSVMPVPAELDGVLREMAGLPGA